MKGEYTGKDGRTYRVSVHDGEAFTVDVWLPEERTGGFFQRTGLRIVDLSAAKAALDELIVVLTWTGITKGTPTRFESVANLARDEGRKRYDEGYANGKADALEQVRELLEAIDNLLPEIVDCEHVGFQNAFVSVREVGQLRKLAVLAKAVQL